MKGINILNNKKYQLKENKNIESGYTLILNSRKTIDIVSKDKKGDPSVYKTTIIVEFTLNDEKLNIKQKEFNSSFKRRSNQSKFDLSQYQKNIELNLINEISENIFIYCIELKNDFKII